MKTKIYLIFLLLLLSLSLLSCSDQRTLIIPSSSSTSYGEIYNKLDSGFEIIDLVTPDMYVQVTNLTLGSLNSFTSTNGNLTATNKGYYKVSVSSSVYATSVGGQYSMKLYNNEIGLNNCYDSNDLGGTHTPMGFNCIVYMDTGDSLSVRFDDHSNPVRDVVVTSMNLNTVLI